MKTDFHQYNCEKSVFISVICGPFFKPAPDFYKRLITFTRRSTTFDPVEFVQDPVLSKWRQTYVDSFGIAAEYAGEYKDAAMRLTGEAHRRNGQKALSRMTFFNLSPDKVRQLVESSTDEGKTWKTVVDLIYARRK